MGKRALCLGDFVAYRTGPAIKESPPCPIQSELFIAEVNGQKKLGVLAPSGPDPLPALADFVAHHLKQSFILVRHQPTHA